MALVLKDRVRESSISTGTGAFTLAGAVAGYQAFSAVMSVADTCWYAIILPGSAWETGVGTYSALNTLTRTTVLESSNAGAAVSFAAGSKDVFIVLPASKGNVLNNAFPSGTAMLFQQTAAPTYWTKQVTHNDKALRVVSGTVSSGGTNAFSAVMAQTTVGNTTPTTTTMAAHAHTSNAVINAGVNSDITPGSVAGVGANGGATINSNGTGTAHNHTISMDILYVDLIIATKD